MWVIVWVPSVIVSSWGIVFYHSFRVLREDIRRDVFIMLVARGGRDVETVWYRVGEEGERGFASEGDKPSQVREA